MRHNLTTHKTDHMRKLPQPSWLPHTVTVYSVVHKEPSQHHFASFPSVGYANMVIWVPEEVIKHAEEENEGITPSLTCSLLPMSAPRMNTLVARTVNHSFNHIGYD